MYPAQVPCSVFLVAPSSSLFCGTFPFEGLLSHKLSQAAGQVYLLKDGEKCAMPLSQGKPWGSGCGPADSLQAAPSAQAQQALRSCVVAPSALVLCWVLMVTVIKSSAVCGDDGNPNG